MLTEPQPSNGQDATRRPFEAPNFVRDRLFRGRLRSLREQRHGAELRRFHSCMAAQPTAQRPILFARGGPSMSKTICGYDRTKTPPSSRVEGVTRGTSESAKSVRRLAENSVPKMRLSGDRNVGMTL